MQLSDELIANSLIFLADAFQFLAFAMPILGVTVGTIFVLSPRLRRRYGERKLRLPALRAFFRGAAPSDTAARPTPLPDLSIPSTQLL